MSIVTPRKLETVEEAKLHQVQAALELVATLKALIADPSLLSKMGEEAKRSLEMTAEEVKKRDTVTADLKTVETRTAKLAAKEDELNSRESSLNHTNDMSKEEHVKRLADLETIQAQHNAEVEAATAKLDATRGELDKRDRDLDGRVSEIDGREARLTLREKELEAAYKTKHVNLDKLHNDRLAALETREQAVDAKVQKLAAAKEALQGA